MKYTKWIESNTSSLAGNTIAITGSTSALGEYLCTIFAKLNAKLLLINRNKDKTTAQINKLLTLYPNANIKFIKCDLQDFENVKTAVETLKKHKIDILYLCSGAYNIERYTTNIGYDNVFQTNFVSHYYIVKELLPQLNANNGHVVAVSSIAYNYSKLDEIDFDFKTRKKHSLVYGNSKRFLTFSLIELFKNQKATLSIVHPGVTLTNMTNHYHKSINWLVKIFVKMLFPTPEKASLSLIKGTFDNSKGYQWFGPSTFNIWGFPKKQKLKYSSQESQSIFNIAEQIYLDIKEKY